MVMDSNPWKVLHEEVRHSCPYFDVRQDLVSHAGQSARAYHSVRVKHVGVCVLPVDQQGQLALVGQYRYVLGRYTWELPGGGAPVGADPLDVARQELKEECGYRAGKWLRPTGGDVSPATFDARTIGYVAWELEQSEPQPEAEESLSLRKVTFGEAVDLVLRGEVTNLNGAALLLATQVRAGQGSLPEDLFKLLCQRLTNPM
jgi:8-oxo-dGTP pyrophosphatase MutT (NUDIX family)